MLEKGKISVRQFTVLIIFFTIGTSILIGPSLLANWAEQDAWIAAVLGVAGGLLIILLLNQVIRMYPNDNLPGILEHVFGRWVGKGLALWFFMFSLILSAIMIRVIGDFMIINIFRQTPIEVIHVMVIFLGVMGVRLGLEVLGRSAEIFLPWVVLMLLFLFVFLAPQMKMENIQPILEGGFGAEVLGGYNLLAITFLETVIFLMIAPYTNRPKKMRRGFFIGGVIGGVVLIVVTLFSIAVLGAGIASQELYTSYVLAKKIDIGQILQRVESILAALWFLTVYYKFAICFYASTLSLAEIAGLRDYRPLVLPLGSVLLTLSLVVSPNISYYLIIATKTWPPYATTVGLLLPLLILLFGGIKKNLGKRGS